MPQNRSSEDPEELDAKAASTDDLFLRSSSWHRMRIPSTQPWRLPSLIRLAHSILHSLRDCVNGSTAKLDNGICTTENRKERRQKFIPSLGFRLHNYTHGRKVISEACLWSKTSFLFQSSHAVRMCHLVEDVALTLHVCADHLQVVLRSFMKSIHYKLLAI